MVHNRRVMVARARPWVSRSRAKHSMSAPGLEQADVVLVAPARVLAQIQLIRLAGQAAFL
jgi:hypothetical protein